MSAPSRRPVAITPGFLLGIALLLFFDDGSGLPVWLLLAGVCHEGGHLLAAWLLGLEVRALRLSFFGAELDLPGRGRCPWYQEVLLLAAGPGVNLLLAALCQGAWGGRLSLFAGVNLLLGCFNLVPVPPLDGGGIVAALCARLFPGAWGLSVSDCVGSLARGALLGLGGYLAFQGNASLLLVALWLVLGSP